MLFVLVLCLLLRPSDGYKLSVTKISLPRGVGKTVATRFSQAGDLACGTDKGHVLVYRVKDKQGVVVPGALGRAVSRVAFDGTWVAAVDDASDLLLCCVAGQGSLVQESLSFHKAVARFDPVLFEVVPPGVLLCLDRAGHLAFFSLKEKRVAATRVAIPTVSGLTAACLSADNTAVVATDVAGSLYVVELFTTTLPVDKWAPQVYSLHKTGLPFGRECPRSIFVVPGSRQRLEVTVGTNDGSLLSVVLGRRQLHDDLALYACAGPVTQHGFRSADAVVSAKPLPRKRAVLVTGGGHVELLCAQEGHRRVLAGVSAIDSHAPTSSFVATSDGSLRVHHVTEGSTSSPS